VQQHWQRGSSRAGGELWGRWAAGLKADCYWSLLAHSELCPGAACCKSQHAHVIIFCCGVICIAGAAALSRCWQYVVASWGLSCFVLAVPCTLRKDFETCVLSSNNWWAVERHVTCMMHVAVMASIFGQFEGYDALRCVVNVPDRSCHRQTLTRELHNAVCKL
jgi:hypothetical protein